MTYSDQTTEIKNITSVPPPIPASESIINVTETPKTNGSVSTTSLAVSKPVDPIPSSGSIQRFLNKAADEGLVIIQSPKVRNLKLMVYIPYIVHTLKP